METDQHSKITISRGKTTIEKSSCLLQQLHHLMHQVTFLCMSSGSLQHFLCLPSHILSGGDRELGSLFCRPPVERSFCQQRMCLLVPHHPPCVQNNLHNCSEKCQYTGSMVIRHFQHYPRMPLCDLRNSVSEMSRAADDSHCFSCSDNLMVNTEMCNNVSPESLLFYFIFVVATWNGRTDEHKRIRARRKLGPPFPDRILVASYVSAGSARSQTS